MCSPAVCECLFKDGVMCVCEVGGGGGSEGVVKELFG